MSIDSILYLGYHTLTTALLIAGPMLLTALVVGTLVSLVQAVTQLQEMTLVFVPKIASVVIVMVLLGGWMLQTAVTFGVNTWESIANLEE